MKVIEARQLQGANIQPVAKVTVSNQTKQTRVKKSTNSPSWNEAFFFNFKKSPLELMDELIEFKVSSCSVYNYDIMENTCQFSKAYEMKIILYVIFLLFLFVQVFNSKKLRSDALIGSFKVRIIFFI